MNGGAGRIGITNAGVRLVGTFSEKLRRVKPKEKT
jgi:hypothetical protein